MVGQYTTVHIPLCRSKTLGKNLHPRVWCSKVYPWCYPWWSLKMAWGCWSQWLWMHWYHHVSEGYNAVTHPSPRRLLYHCLGVKACWTVSWGIELEGGTVISDNASPGESMLMESQLQKQWWCMLVVRDAYPWTSNQNSNHITWRCLGTKHKVGHMVWTMGTHGGYMLVFSGRHIAGEP